MYTDISREQHRLHVLCLSLLRWQQLGAEQQRCGRYPCANNEFNSLEYTNSHLYTDCYAHSHCNRHICRSTDSHPYPHAYSLQPAHCDGKKCTGAHARTKSA